MNIFGQMFRFMTWGESHGPALGVVVDGCPPGIEVDLDALQMFLDRRRPGQNKFVTQRQEADEVKILSGVFENVTTGTPICMMIENTDQRSKDYGEIAQQFRPGHADFPYWAKYGLRDYRGGGRASARETAARVAAGALAQQVLAQLLPHPIEALCGVEAIGPIHAESIDFTAANSNDFFFLDQSKIEELSTYLMSVRKNGSSIGARLRLLIKDVPVGLGSPVAGRLDARLASDMMSVNAVKSVEIGAGSRVAFMSGEENADPMYLDDQGQVAFSKNNAGGILGGISTGADIDLAVAIKPTSSILTPVNSLNIHGESVAVRTKGRHDPCVGIRAVPVLEAMAYCTILDHWLLHRGQVGHFFEGF